MSSVVIYSAEFRLYARAEMPGQGDALNRSAALRV